MRIDKNKQEEVACNLEISQTYLRLEYYNRAAIGFEKHVKYVQEKRLEQTDKRYLQSCLNLGVSLLNAGKYKRSE